MRSSMQGLVENAPAQNYTHENAFSYGHWCMGGEDQDGGEEEYPGDRGGQPSEARPRELVPG
jgi:hypothetical protein